MNNKKSMNGDLLSPPASEGELLNEDVVSLFDVCCD